MLDALPFPAGAPGGPALVVLLVAGFIAAMARGFSGFGAAMIFFPVASATVGPRTATAVFLLTDFVLAAGMLPRALRTGNRPEVGWMSLGALVGVPLGTMILAMSDPEKLRWVVAGIIVALLGFLMTGWRYEAQPKRRLTVALGAVSGVLSGIAQLAGPVVVAYWMGSRASISVVRANLILFFTVTAILSIASYLLGGLITWGTAVLSLGLAPVYALGLWLGARLSGLASDLVFRRICLALIAGSAVLGLPVLDGVLGR